MGRGGTEGGFSWSTFWDPCSLGRFISFLGRLSFCWMEGGGGGGVRGGGGGLLFASPWCLGWYPNKDGLGMG